MNNVMKTKVSKTKTSFYRRQLVAYLIDSGVNTVPSLLDATQMPKNVARYNFGTI
ncbi:conserved hypothetical protein (plasmid) [Aliivibrio fischeri MJ11]|uniref:Uncharacterized protein n=1 Tax=Aliivibrio fischeri (strain MJ11) TaxID=388396 RepID=B5EWC7_ALIFM|nr:conserved hypothetical protein [Aliivibrio fischeri MJ11]